MFNFLKLFLLPFSLIYGIITYIRNKFYDWKIFKSYSFDVPVISIGNLSVGGTGKTPHLEYLISLLEEKYNIATLSRGYKRKTKGFIIASENSIPEQIGDEPLQFKKKFPNITVAVDEDRVNGIKRLLENPQRLTTNYVILLDDAFQHRRAKSGLSILLTDFNNLFYNDSVLPSGRLREFRNGYKRADIIIVTKTPENLTLNIRQNIIEKIKPLPSQNIYFSYVKYCPLKPLNPLQNSHEHMSTLAHELYVFLFAGIANPNLLEKKVKEMCADLTAVWFNDHHNYSKDDILIIKDKFQKIPGDNKIIITTEKDAMRLNKTELFDILKDLPVYYLPIEIEFHKEDKLAFNNQILQRL